jgi:hypothetical protein
MCEAILTEWTVVRSSGPDLSNARGLAGLLRPRRERPRGRAAEQRDELATRHSITSSARASSVAGTSNRVAGFSLLRIQPV